MNTLTITETNPDEQSVQRLSVALDDISPAQIQAVLSILYRTPRKPRSDKKKGEQA